MRPYTCIQIISNRNSLDYIFVYKYYIGIHETVYFLFIWVLWHINLCKLFNAKSIFIQRNRSISNNSFQHKYSVCLSKTFLFHVIQFSQTVLIQTIQFSISIVFVYKQLNVKIVPFQTIQFCVSTVSMSKTHLFQTIQFSIQKQFYFEQFSLV